MILMKMMKTLVGSIIIGSKVFHSRFGEGIVLDIENDNNYDYAIIQFEDSIHKIQLINGQNNNLSIIK